MSFSFSLPNLQTLYDEAKSHQAIIEQVNILGSRLIREVHPAFPEQIILGMNICFCVCRHFHFA